MVGIHGQQEWNYNRKANQIRNHLEDQRNNLEFIDNHLAEEFGEQVKHEDMIIMSD
jgi:hypothetical protein